MAKKDDDPLAVSERLTLYYRDGSSDKVYQASIEPAEGGHIVNFAYGRRGSTLTTGTKTAVPVDYPAAKKIFDKLVNEKRAKGYTPGEGGTPYQHTDNEQRATGIFPQLLNPIDEEELEPFLTDDRWWVQEKLDGRRLLIRKAAGEVTAINRKGLTVGLSQPIAVAIASLAAEACLLDGEAVGDAYHAFDLLERDAQDLRASSYAIRYANLRELVVAGSNDGLHYVPVASTTERKQAMLDSLRRDHKEGVVFKDSTAKYAAGRPASGGSQRKHKFYATVSCLVGAVSAAKRSVALEVFADDSRVSIGRVTIPANHPVPRTGAVVEVRYLYFFKGGSLFQPVFLGVREDIVATSCLLEGLKLKASDEEDAEA